MNRFKELKVWQESVELSVMIYNLTSNFPSEEKFGLISQARRAVISVSSNIAEGSGRNSDKEFRNFLGYAIASTFELESQMIISEKLGFTNSTDLLTFSAKILLIQNMLYKLQKNLINKKIETILT
jgi:four helix bundle protein